MNKLLKEEYDFYYFIRQRFSTYREKMRKDLPETLWNETLHLEDLRKKIQQMKRIYIRNRKAT